MPNTPNESAIEHHNFGMLAPRRGDHPLASEHYTAGDRLAEVNRDSQLAALWLLNHAEVLVALPRPTEARYP